MEGGRNVANGIRKILTSGTTDLKISFRHVKTIYSFVTDLQSIFAGGLEEDAGEELGAGLHLKPLLDLLTLAGEAGEKEIVKILDVKLLRRLEYLTTPVATSMKHPTKRPVDGGFPEGSLLTFDISFEVTKSCIVITNETICHFFLAI